MHNPHVYLDFWGPWWSSSAESPMGIVPAMQSLFYQLAGGDYNNILSQYTDNNGAPNNFIHNDVNWATTWENTGATPPASLTMTRIGQEAANAITTNKWANTSDTLIFVFPQPGTAYDSSFNTPGDVTCGEHAYGSGNVIFAMVRYTADQSACNYGSGSTAGDMQEVASHEYAEMATDPEVGPAGAWQTSDGYEIGDLCNWGAQSYTPVSSSQSLNVTLLWDNLATNNSYPHGQCMLQSGQEFVSTDTTSPFHGMHTVQGAILTHYYAFGAAGSPMGGPISEETPITDADGNLGRVSYFANGCGAGAAIYWSPATGAYTVWGCIMAHYKSIGETHSALGFPVTDETNAPGGGRVNYFAGTNSGSHCTAYGGPAPYTNSYGAIYWTGSAAYAVKGCIYNYYQDVAGGPVGSMGLGLPAGEEGPWYGGIIEPFAGSSCGSSSGSAIYDSNGTGVHAVKGCLYYYYNTYYGGTSGAGFPTSDELSMGGGHGQHFSNTGCGAGGNGIYDGPGTGVSQVIGCIYQEYLGLGEANSFLGFPTYDETDAPGGGRVSYFGGTTWGSHCGTVGPYNSYGAIFWTGGSGAHEVHGCIYDAYLHQLGGTGGWLGYPIYDQADPYVGGHVQQFQHGYICDVNGNISAYSNNVYPAPC